MGAEVVAVAEDGGGGDCDFGAAPGFDVGEAEVAGEASGLVARGIELAGRQDLEAVGVEGRRPWLPHRGRSGLPCCWRGGGSRR